MIAVVAAVIAGAIGAAVRWRLSRALADRAGFPWAILVVNVVGSGIGGAVLGLAERGVVSGDIRLVLVGGLCGGLTTFSTWSVETIELVQSGRWRAAAINVGATLALSLGVAATAFMLARG